MLPVQVIFGIKLHIYYKKWALHILEPKLKRIEQNNIKTGP